MFDEPVDAPQPAAQIPASAGMTEASAGMTKASAGMTESSDGMTEATERPRAVPLARKLAAEARIDLGIGAAAGAQPYDPARDVRAALENASRPTWPSSRRTPDLVRDKRNSGGARQAQPAANCWATRSRGASGRHRASARCHGTHPQFTVWRALDLTSPRGGPQSLKGVSLNTILLRAYALMLREPSLNGR